MVLWHCVITLLAIMRKEKRCKQAKFTRKRSIPKCHSLPIQPHSVLCVLMLPYIYNPKQPPLSPEKESEKITPYLYNPTQSPFSPDVNCGPECSSVFRNSSGSKGFNLGGCWNVKLDWYNNINWELGFTTTFHNSGLQYITGRLTGSNMIQIPQYVVYLTTMLSLWKYLHVMHGWTFQLSPTGYNFHFFNIIHGHTLIIHDCIFSYKGPYSNNQASPFSKCIIKSSCIHTRV